jgi:radical SAM superfamily enzyme YgiQ (UPF0313 family)
MEDHPTTGLGDTPVGVDIRPRRATTSVALVRPPVVVLPDSLAVHGPVPPIGLAYVAAAVRAAGHRVQFVDAPSEALEQWVPCRSPTGDELARIGLSPAEIVDRIQHDTEVIGITNMFHHEWPQVREIVALARERFPDASIVLGGENPTAFWRTMMAESPGIDCCVLGEGEATFVELLARLAEGRSLRGTGGVAYRDPATGEPVDEGLSERLSPSQLTTQPRPAWDLVPLENYWAHYPFLGVNRGRSMPVLGTRGCPYQCSFCSSPQMWTTRFTMREPEDVVDEIEDYARRYGVQNVNFVDLTAATNRKWILGLCDALERRVPGVSWQLPIGTRSEAIDAEVLQRLHDTGCRNIALCPESGSERMIEIFRKKVKLAHILESVRVANRIGVHTVVHIIIGHPDETWPDIWKSTRFLVRAALDGCSDAAVIQFCPYPGSEDFRRLVADGVLEVDEASYYVGLTRSSAAARSWNRRMSSRQLRWLQLGMLGVFYATAVLRRPRRVVEFVRAIATDQEETYLDQVVRTRRRNLTPVAADVHQGVHA